jgi:hypothetical protein
VPIELRGKLSPHCRIVTGEVDGEEVVSVLFSFHSHPGDAGVAEETR